MPRYFNQSETSTLFWKPAWSTDANKHGITARLSDDSGYTGHMLNSESEHYLDRVLVSFYSWSRANKLPILKMSFDDLVKVTLETVPSNLMNSQRKYLEPYWLVTLALLTFDYILLDNCPWSFSIRLHPLSHHNFSNCCQDLQNHRKIATARGLVPSFGHPLVTCHQADQSYVDK